MILDELSEFCDATAMNTGGAGTYLIGDVIDLGANGTLKDIGNGRTVYFVAQVTTTFVGATNTTNLQLVSDSTANLATSPTVHWQSGAVPVATWVAGYRYVVPLPIEKRYERYLGVTHTTAVAALSAGAIDAFLTLDPVGWFAVPDGVN